MESFIFNQQELRFTDRFDAGRRLAEKLMLYRDDPQAVVVTIPRGGVQIGFVLATTLGLKLDVILTKKIGHPANPEYAIGAVSLKNVVLNDDELTSGGITLAYLQREIGRIRKLLATRDAAYHARVPHIPLTGKTVILTDDGLATGRTALAAIDLIRQERPHKIVVAVPIAAEETLAEVRKRADEAVCLAAPALFHAISQFYDRFEQIGDEEAVHLLEQSDGVVTA